MLERIDVRPESVAVVADSGVFGLQRQPDGSHAVPGTVVRLREDAEGLHVTLHSPGRPIRAVQLVWPVALPSDARVLGDHWERSYGDMEWRAPDLDRVLPWVFSVAHGGGTACCGVKVRPSAPCWWQAGDGLVRLNLDVRSGHAGVRLGERTLEVATVITRETPDPDPFPAIMAFYRLLCPDPVTPADPPYGFNDFYYIYTQNSQETTLRDSDLLAELAPAGRNRPFSVVDCGWQLCGNIHGGPWQGNRFYPDMPGLARQIKDRGLRPGIWVRFLKTHVRTPTRLLRDVPVAGESLDPSLPEGLAEVEGIARMLAVEWGYELIKHDFSSWDIFGKWGNHWGNDPMPACPRNFSDLSRTTAEIILDFYRAIRRGAGSALVLGCNVIGHLAAGLVEMNRTGDDTSGQGWGNNPRHGVNALAFEMPHQGAFYHADADCVALHDVPWRQMRKWLEVVTISGTPLFVSANPKSTGPEQKQALREAFARASRPQPPAQPLDWFDTPRPTRWQATDGIHVFDWEYQG